MPRTATARRPLSVLATVLTAVLAAVVLPALPAAAAPAAPTSLPTGIEAFAPYQGVSACDPVARPGVVAFRDMVLAAYPGTGDAGIARACTVGGASEHKEGRAWDWRVTTARADDVVRVEDLMQWLLAPDAAGNDAAMARRLGVMYVIWDSRIWRSYQASRGWQPYTGASPHTDHVHLSFSWAGALAATSFWSGKVAGVLQRPVPPPPATTSDTATVGVKVPLLSRQAVVQRRRTAVQSLPGPWRRH